MLHVWNLMFQHLNPNMTQINGYAIGMPQSLLGESAWQAVKPGVILQLFYGTCPSTNIMNHSWVYPMIGWYIIHIPLLYPIIGWYMIHQPYIYILLLLLLLLLLYIYISHCWVPIYHMMQYPQYLVVKLWHLPEIGLPWLEALHLLRQHSHQGLDHLRGAADWARLALLGDLAVALPCTRWGLL